MCMHQPLTSPARSPGASDVQVPFHMCGKGGWGEVIFKSSGPEVITYHSAVLVGSTQINRFLLLVLLRPEVAAGSAKPVVPINVGNASTDMGNPPGPALRAAQEAGDPFQQFLPSPEDAPRQQQPPMRTSAPIWSAKPLWDSTDCLCWFYQTLL